MGYGKKILTAVHDFLKFEGGAVIRNAPSTKQRKYKNIQITEDFKKIDNQRKLKRVQSMNKYKVLLQQKVNTQTKLLSSQQNLMIQQQIKSLQEMIDVQQKQIGQLGQKIEQLQPDYMVVEGPLKIAVINQIKYLQYLDTHHHGIAIHPQTIKAIQNIHYCVNHNLPLSRIKLFQIMPQLFEGQIGQLDQAIQRLIYEKKLYDIDEDGSIQHFDSQKVLIKAQDQEPTIQQLQLQRQYTFMNLQLHIEQVLQKHTDLIQKVKKGQTPFRNIKHLHNLFLSDLKINYLPQQQALRKDVLQIVQQVDKFNQYSKDLDQKLQRIKHSYQQPPPYIKNHPQLMKRWDQLMQTVTNPVDYAKSSIALKPRPQQIQHHEFAEKLQQRIRQVVRQKFDPIFVQQMNTNRSLIDKKKIQIDFYNMTTQVLQELQLLQKPDQQQEIFKKLPKQQYNFLKKSNRTQNHISLNQFTRIMYLNRKDPKKYNSAFFSSWFGVQKQTLQAVLNSISYIQVPVQQQSQSPKYFILKFEM